MGEVVFTELQGGRVFEIDAQLDPASLTPLGGSTLRGPSGPDRDASGTVVVAELAGDRIALADPGGGWTHFGTTGGGDRRFRRPSAAAFLGGGLVVLDAGNFRLAFMDDITGSGWRTYGHGGSGEGGYRDPRGLAVDEFGRVWVADPKAGRITRIDGDDGNGWRSFALPAGSAPYGLCVYGEGVIAVDVANRRVLVVDDNGAVPVPLADPTWVSPAFVGALDDVLVFGDLMANELRTMEFDGAAFVERARLRGSPPDVVVPLFDSIGGVGA
jgi:streptogramin lyase